MPICTENAHRRLCKLITLGHARRRASCTAMAAKRMRGLAVSRPVLIGSTATPLTPAEKLAAPPDHTHRWTVAVRSVASAPLPTLPPTAGAAAGGSGGNAAGATPDSGSIGTRLRDSELDLHRAVGGKDDLSYFIKRVQFRLHETYPQPTRNVDRAPFSVTETGWGEFEIQIKIFFVPEAGEKPLTLVHHLKLHPWTSQAAGPPPAGPDTSAGSAAEPDPAAAAAAAPAGDAAASGASAPPTPPVVHSWQYEEIVFPEPLEPFYDILLAHPPTPYVPLCARDRDSLTLVPVSYTHLTLPTKRIV